MRRHPGIFVGVLILLGAWVTTAQAVTLVNCGPSGYIAGDGISRGFYLPSYPGNSLQSVALRFQGGASAAGTLTLTAHAGTYDGPLIGSSTLAVTGPISAASLRTFVFAGNPPVSPGGTVAFSITAAGGVTGSAILYSVFNSFAGDPSCPVIETAGTVPPLDTFRRQGVEIVLTGNSATLVSCGPSGYASTDGINRGFYVPSYRGNSLRSVALRLQGGASASGTVTLTARAGAYDGPFIGSSSLPVTGPISSAGLLTFVFPGSPAVSPGSTVAFSITALGGITGDSIFYSVATTFAGDPSCPVIETVGTTPPLDEDRRRGVEIILTGGAPFLLASVNQSIFSLGQTLSAGGAVINRGLPSSADFYVGLLRPDGVIEFFTPAGIVLGNVADLTSFRPVATAVPLGTPFVVNAPNFFTHPWTASQLRGSYVFFVAAAVAGAVATGSVTNDQILGLATAPVSFP